MNCQFLKSSGSSNNSSFKFLSSIFSSSSTSIVSVEGTKLTCSGILDCSFSCCSFFFSELVALKLIGFVLSLSAEPAEAAESADIMFAYVSINSINTSYVVFPQRTQRSRRGNRNWLCFSIYRGDRGEC